ncbi:MAG: hypothetical protein DRJ42_26200, partial [Deltaproteobacteria bacterium]
MSRDNGKTNGHSNGQLNGKMNAKVNGKSNGKLNGKLNGKSDGQIPAAASVLGVGETLVGKHLLVTGVTGFLGKIWLTMLLE